MSKQTRRWVRLILLIIMLALVGFTLYQAIVQKDQGKPELGQQAPDFALTSLDGKQVKLSDLHGKAVMINFWGSWCEPCRTEMPAIQSMYEKYRKLGFVVIGINIAETDVAAAQFVKQYQLNFPIWMDRNREVVRLYRIGPIPSSIFIDRSGKIIDSKDGPLVPSELEKQIRPLVFEK
ncbi:Peroxiredoxin [Seinonella peptonophila]|uniref:Peroxiredoxin n=1 Tax=Seinonella peptonophila TaxID=112248 RepID=A0A1M4V0Q4_9BACL|nr:thiol-disulfide oxidoreductase ResA [Seinonella peptonophila]SHE62490.1 Peroxiredoxin [Seinonella peptonophila]